MERSRPLVRAEGRLWTRGGVDPAQENFGFSTNPERLSGPSPCPLAPLPLPQRWGLVGVEGQLSFLYLLTKREGRGAGRVGAQVLNIRP